MANFDMAELALKSVCPNNAMKYDDREMPSVMVFIPKFRLCKDQGETSSIIDFIKNSTTAQFLADIEQIERWLTADNFKNPVWSIVREHSNKIEYLASLKTKAR